MTTPGLRRQMVALFADDLRDPRSWCSVWRWSNIGGEGALDQHFYLVLLCVAGFRTQVGGVKGRGLARIETDAHGLDGM